MKLWLKLVSHKECVSPISKEVWNALGDEAKHEGNCNTCLEKSFCRERAISLCSRIRTQCHESLSLGQPSCHSLLLFHLNISQTCMMSWKDIHFHTPLGRKYFCYYLSVMGSVYSIMLSTKLLKDMRKDILRPITVLINRNECSSNGQRNW